ncbi:MAG: ACP synthase [Pseudomonadota bacterium]
MNEVTDDPTGTASQRGAHPGDLKLRRLVAGESWADAAAAAAHAEGCAECAKRLDGLAAEQRAFEDRISFDRFAAGVERAARVPGPAVASSERWWNRPASTRSFMTVFSVAAAAACLVLVLGVRPLFENARLRRDADQATTAANRIKGDVHAGVTFRIAPANEGPQRTAAVEAPEALSAGERIRVGVQPGARRFLFAFSIDDGGVVTPLYPEVGTSMPLPNGGRMQYLPDSLELTGNGRERVVILLTDVPLELDTVRRAAAVAFRQAGGNLARLTPLALPGEQFHRLFLKP